MVWNKPLFRFFFFLFRWVQLRSGKLRRMLVFFIIVFCLKKNAGRLVAFMRSSVYDDGAESYCLERYLISSFVDCHLNGPLSFNEYKNLHFNDLLIDGDQSEYVLYLERYFLSLAVF